MKVIDALNASLKMTGKPRPTVGINQGDATFGQMDIIPGKEYAAVSVFCKIWEADGAEFDALVDTLWTMVDPRPPFQN